MEELNTNWMEEYERSYKRFQTKWDYHYSKVRTFIFHSLKKPVDSMAIIGITPSLPEIDEKILSKINKIYLLDIYREGMIKAEQHLKQTFNYANVMSMFFDNTAGLVNNLSEIFNKYEIEKITEEQLFSFINQIEMPKINYSGPKFDSIAHLGVMDYYFMPLFSKFCELFSNRYTEFYHSLQNLNDMAVKISFKMFNEMIDRGNIIISTPISRYPIGTKCKTSLFWKKSIEEHAKDAGFQIIDSSTHIWEEFPITDGHSHEILNINCKK